MANLITLDEYKISENIQSTKEDARINSLISAVSQLVKTYCGNSFIDFYSTDKTETFTINWETDIVQLTESPVNSLATVKERTSFDGAYTTLDASKDYYFDGVTDAVFRINSDGSRKNFPRGPKSVEVSYRAGYSACPADLQLAVIDLITYYMKDEHKARQTIAGASIQNQGSTSQRNNVAFPDHIKRVLDLYKNF